MIRIDSNTEFFPEGEPIELPASYKHLMTNESGNYIYGNGRQGRELSHGWNSDYQCFGWSCTKINIDMIDDCCEA